MLGLFKTDDCNLRPVAGPMTARQQAPPTTNYLCAPWPALPKVGNSPRAHRRFIVPTPKHLLNTCLPGFSTNAVQNNGDSGAATGWVAGSPFPLHRRLFTYGQQGGDAPPFVPEDE